MRRTTTLYRYLTGTDDAAFSRAVSEALAAGWILTGPTALAYNAMAGSVVRGQAVTKDIDAAAYDPAKDLTSY